MIKRITWRFIWAKADVSSSNTSEVTIKSMKNPKMRVSLKWFSSPISLKLIYGVFSLFHLQIANKWTQNSDRGFKLKYHKWFFSFSIQSYIALAYPCLKHWFDWVSKNTFSVDGEKPSQFWSHLLNRFDFSFLTNQSKGTNVRQFPTRSNFQILNIISSLRGISFYFPPLEVVHPVLTDRL